MHSKSPRAETVTTQTGVPLRVTVSDSQSQTHRVEYDPESTAASEAVVAAVADALDADPSEMERLYFALNPDALDDLLAPRRKGDEPVHISFSFSGFDVTISSAGSVELRPAGRHT